MCSDINKYIAIDQCPSSPIIMIIIIIIIIMITRQSAQWGMYTPGQHYRHFLKSTKYVALSLVMAVVYYIL